jgi:magnesium-transporting ATPase (P-type)
VLCSAGLGGLLILTIDLITEQGPAISLAYEPAEALVMERPPRDIKNDRLINGPLLRYAYLTYGIMTVRQRSGVWGESAAIKLIDVT